MARNQLVTSVGSDQQGWAVWEDGESVYAQQFVASDAIPPPTDPHPGCRHGHDNSDRRCHDRRRLALKISAGAVGETDRATITGAKASTATGTVTYNLYSASSCTASSEVFHGGTVSVTGGVAAPSPVSHPHWLRAPTTGRRPTAATPTTSPT